MYSQRNFLALLWVEVSTVTRVALAEHPVASQKLVRSLFPGDSRKSFKAGYKSAGFSEDRCNVTPMGCKQPLSAPRQTLGTASDGRLHACQRWTEALLTGGTDTSFQHRPSLCASAEIKPSANGKVGWIPTLGTSHNI